MTARDVTAGAVSVIVPSMNETENLLLLLPRIPEEYEVVVVEGCDLDYTREFVRRVRPAATVISQSRRGKGNALLCGCEEATGEYLIMLDADGSADPAEIPAFVDALRAGADMAKGSRYMRAGGSDDLTLLRSNGNVGFTVLTNLLFRTRFTDLCYGYNAFTRDMVPRFELPETDERNGAKWGDGFEIETLFACRAALSGAKIVEVPSYEYDRVHGTSNLNAWRDGKRVLRTIVHEWLTHHGRRLRRIAENHPPEPEMPKTPPPPPHRAGPTAESAEATEAAEAAEAAK